MMSFRFHLVSLTAVFLAFALGIVIGSTVVDKATVDVLEGRIKAVRASAQRADRARDELRKETDRWDRFSSEMEVDLVRGRLQGVRVLLVSTEGADAEALEALRADLAQAGSVDAGAVVLSTGWNKDEPRLAERIGAALGVAGPLPRMSALREASATRLATEWAAGGGPTTAALSEAGMLRVTTSAPVAALPGAETRFLVVGGRPANGLALLLARALAQAAPVRAVVTELAPDDHEADPIGTLVGPLREARTEASVTTVDHAEEFRGRVAVVLAVAALGRGQTGDFGSAPGADRTVPAAA